MQIESLPGAVLCWWGSVQKCSSIQVCGWSVPAWGTCLGWQRTGHAVCDKPLPCDPQKYSAFIASEFTEGGKNLIVAKKCCFVLGMSSTVQELTAGVQRGPEHWLFCCSPFHRALSTTTGSCSSCVCTDTRAGVLCWSRIKRPVSILTCFCKVEHVVFCYIACGGERNPLNLKLISMGRL